MYVFGRVHIRFDCDLGCTKCAGRRSPSCNSTGWFMLFGSLQVSIEELACINHYCVCVIDWSIGFGVCSKTKSWKKWTIRPRVPTSAARLQIWHFGCKRYPYFHHSVEYDWKMHWQRNMCREHVGTFSDMIRENDNSESCHVLFFRFFQLVVLVQRQVQFKGVFGCAYRRDASKIWWLEVTNDSQTNHGTVFVTIGACWDAGWNSCRRGGWSV